MVLHGLSRPGKLLLPGSCLLGPASSSCRGPCLECLVFSWRFLGGPRRRVLQLPVHKSGVLRYPYFSTPTLCLVAILCFHNLTSKYFVWRPSKINMCMMLILKK